MAIERLMLIFTYGGKLESWEKFGLLDRELAYYEKMFDAGLQQVDLMTYGHGKVNRKVDGRFRVLTKKWVNHDLIFSLLAPFANWHDFKQCDIMKTNQSQGAWVGWLVKAMMWNKKLVVRCGWVRTEEMMRKDEDRSGLNLWWHQLVERAAFKLSNAIIVVSEIDKAYIVNRYNIPKKKINIIANSVDTSQYNFSPNYRTISSPKRILLIGRLVEMKNFQSVIQAVDGLKEISEVVIAGDGPCRSELEEIAAGVDANIRFLSAIPNKQIPGELSQSDIFILPQFYASGMPKVMLEAMAIGVPVICSDIPVHRYLIKNGVNGFLCGDTSDSILQAIKRVATLNESQHNKLVGQARADVEKSHDMATNAEHEMELYQSLVSD